MPAGFEGGLPPLAHFENPAEKYRHTPEAIQTMAAAMQIYTSAELAAAVLNRLGYTSPLKGTYTKATVESYFRYKFQTSNKADPRIKEFIRQEAEKVPSDTKEHIRAIIKEEKAKRDARAKANLYGRRAKQTLWSDDPQARAIMALVFDTGGSNATAAEILNALGYSSSLSRTGGALHKGTINSYLIQNKDIGTADKQSPEVQAFIKANKDKLSPEKEAEVTRLLTEAHARAAEPKTRRRGQEAA